VAHLLLSVVRLGDFMAGIVHVRIVIAVFLVGGIAALMPYALSLFSEDVKPFLFGWVGGLSSIALALWLSRRSNIARALLILFSRSSRVERRGLPEPAICLRRDANEQRGQAHGDLRKGSHPAPQKFTSGTATIL
jgi:hypothetical protein